MLDRNIVRKIDNISGRRLCFNCEVPSEVEVVVISAVVDVFGLEVVVIGFIVVVDSVLGILVEVLVIGFITVVDSILGILVEVVVSGFNVVVDSMLGILVDVGEFNV